MHLLLLELIEDTLLWASGMLNKMKTLCLFLTLIIVLSLICGVEGCIPGKLPTAYNNPVNNLVNNSNGLIPGTNYSCKDFLPETIHITISRKMVMGQTETDKMGNSILFLELHNAELKKVVDSYLGLSGTCQYNQEVGQKASGFSCEGYFYIKDEIKTVSEEGIILKPNSPNPRKVTYNLFFDDSSCVLDGRSPWNEPLLNCKILNSTCRWEYIPSNLMYDIAGNVLIIK